MKSKKEIKITLDTSAVEPKNPLLKQLTDWQKEGYLKLYVEYDTDFEIEKWENTKRRQEALEWLDQYRYTDRGAFWIPDGVDPIKAIEEAQGYTLEEEGAVEVSIRGIHSPEVKKLRDFNSERLSSKYIDWQILTSHVLNKRDFFVTKDKRDYINHGKDKDGRRKKFEKEFPDIKIRELDEKFIKELETEITNRGFELNKS